MKESDPPMILRALFKAEYINVLKGLSSVMCAYSTVRIFIHTRGGISRVNPKNKIHAYITVP